MKIQENMYLLKKDYIVKALKTSANVDKKTSMNLLKNVCRHP